MPPVRPDHSSPSRRRPRVLPSIVPAVVAVVAVLGSVLPAGAVAVQVDGTGGASALAARVVELDLAIVAVDREVATARAELAATRDDLGDTVREVEAAAARRGRALQDLRGYAVGAYVAGGDPTRPLAEAALTSDAWSPELEGRRVLAVEGSGALLERAAASRAEVEALESELVEVAHAATSRRRAVDEAVERRRRLAEERAAAQAAAEEAARVEREQAEARRLAAAASAAEVEARAGSGPGPAPVASGVVPPRTVPDELVAALGGEIPSVSLDAYWRAAAHVAATRPGCPVDWALIAAVGKVETSHGTYGGARPGPDGAVAPAIVGIPLDGTGGTARILDTDGGWYDGDVELDRAVGPMQFLPGTWRGFAVDGNGDGIGDPHNIYDAAVATGSYLCHNARGDTVDAARRSAVHGYNRSWVYVAKVFGFAERYRTLAGESDPAGAGQPTGG